MNLWAVVGVAALQAAVSVLTTMYLRRAIRLNRDPIERTLYDVEGVVLKRWKGARMNLREYRKGIAVTAGTLLGGLLIYAENSNLEPLLGPLFPAPVRPLVGWALGGLVTVAATVWARNDPKPAPSDDASTIEPSALPAEPGQDAASQALEPAGSALEPAAAASAPAPVAVTNAAAASLEVPTTGPFWAGVTRGEPGAPTSLVDLRPVPRSSPL